MVQIMRAGMMKKYKSGLLHVHTGIQTRVLVLSLLVMMSAWLAVIPRVSAQDLSAPTQVVREYLSSLANGDTQKLVQLIDGRMKQSNRQLVLNPETYSQFLKTNYAGVQMTIEDVAPDGAGVRATVRFDYPSQDSSIIEFLLTETNGLWKITDEVY
jgi:predicted ester cyclase